MAFWKRLGTVPATEDDVARITALSLGSLPRDYVEFLRTYGFVRWMLTVPDRFVYHHSAADVETTGTGSVGHLETPDSIARAMSHAWESQPELGLPRWPRGVMPIAGNAGPGQVLMDLETGAGAIRYWVPSQEIWGTGTNIALATVADTFTDFVQKLRLKA